jgi:hypothetical protein
MAHGECPSAPRGSRSSVSIKVSVWLFIMVSFAFLSASHAARCVACHGIGSQPVPVALVGECSIPVV